MGLKIYPESSKTEKVDITNTSKILTLQNYNFEFNRDQLEKLKNGLGPDQRINTLLDMKKKSRTIE